MNGMKAKRKWEVGEWDSKLANQFQELKDLFCCAFPIALGDPGAGEFTLTTDFSKEAMSGVLHQVQHGVERFIGAKGRKCRGYERNYHSSKVELAALHYSLLSLSTF